MKQIYFIRHAKAKSDGMSDFERKLISKGKIQAQNLGAKLVGIKPQAIFVSAADRAKSTAQIIAETAKFECEITYDFEIYDISTPNLIKFIQNIDDKFDCVFIVGHNPSIAEICQILVENAPDSFPACGAIGARFDCEKFSQIGEGYMPPQIKNTQKTAKADAKNISPKYGLNLNNAVKMELKHLAQDAKKDETFKKGEIIFKDFPL
jgi:phosphohistidine phosphatase sixA